MRAWCFWHTLVIGYSFSVDQNKVELDNPMNPQVIRPAHNIFLMGSIRYIKIT